MARTVLPSWAVRVLMRRYIVSGMSSVVLMALIISYLIRHINMDLLIYAYPLERAQDFLPSLPRRFLLIDGKRFNLYLAPCHCFRRYAARARASALFFPSTAFFSAARRLIASIVSSLCGIAIVSTPAFLLHQ